MISNQIFSGIDPCVCIDNKYSENLWLFRFLFYLPNKIGLIPQNHAEIAVAKHNVLVYLKSYNSMPLNNSQINDKTKLIKKFKIPIYH